MNNPIVKLLLQAAGLGTGATFAWVLLEMWKSQPGAMVQLATNWGPMAMICFAGMWFVDRRIGEGVQVMRDNTAAQQGLADAVKQIAAKDDREAEEQKRMLHFVGSKMEELILKVDGMTASSNSVAKGRGAGTV